MFTMYKIGRTLMLSLCATLSLPTLAGSSSVIYPKVNNNGNNWYAPSPALTSSYDNYFVNMDKLFKSQLVSDPQFSESLQAVCGEVSALFYRYLHNQTEKNLFNATSINNNGLQTKEALPFTSTQSQFYTRDMVVEYPMPSVRGRYRGQFVYEYTLKAGNKSIFQLKKNAGGGNGKSKQILFLAYMNNFYIDVNGNKQTASTSPSYVMLKIDRLTTIKGFTSEKHAFEQGQQSCTWLSNRLN